ncbi:AAA family ATPase [Thermoflexus sp.]|uniref:AAA family ATPase n=1 Tax=Thermoflexus sp. TaxID=1969742 RepID=UPI002ADDA194|nr:AAA family ATPase [Thermoflexus sp.]
MSEKVRIFLSAAGQEALTALYGTALQDPRFSVVGLAPTAELLQAQLPASAAEAALVDAELLVPLGERGILEFLQTRHGGAALLVAIPPALEPLRGALLALDRVREVVAKPYVPGEVLSRLWQIAQSERAMKASLSPAAALRTEISAPAGTVAVGTHVFAVTASKGGPGKSTVAVNLAYRLAQHGVRTLLVGFDTPDAVGIQLGLPKAPNMGAWFRSGSREALIGAIQRKDGILDVLLSPNDPIEAARVAFADLIDRAARFAAGLSGSPEAVVRRAVEQALAAADAGRIARLVDEVRSLHPPYAAVVMDLPPTQTEWNIQPLMRATAVLLVAEPSLADQVNAIETLNILTGVLDPRYRVPRQAIYLVLNRVTDRDPLTPQAFREGIEAALGWAPPVIARIPHDPEVRRAQIAFVPPVTKVDAFREGIDQIVAFFFPNLSGRPPARGLQLGGIRIRLGGR